MPKTKFHMLSRLTLAGILASAGCSLLAQEGLTATYKMKAGVTMGDLSDDLNARRAMGMAVEVAYDINKNMGIFGELGFTYFAGRDYTPMPYEFTAGGLFFTQNSAGYGSLNSSFDRRKNKMVGPYVRLGYRMDIGESTWSWQAGLSVDRYRWTQEASGTLRGLDPTTYALVSTEGIQDTPDTAKVNVGAFAGIRKSFGSDFSIEANIASVGYEAVNYVPGSYLGTPGRANATTVTEGRRGLVFELGFGLRF